MGRAMNSRCQRLIAEEAIYHNHWLHNNAHKQRGETKVMGRQYVWLLVDG